MSKKITAVASATIPREIHAGTMTLITGNSGSGKSSLLPSIVEAYAKPSDLAYPSADLERPLIDAWHCTPEEAIKRLTQVGLADPLTWARRYDELSVGQQARFRLADIIAGSGSLVVVDEWLNGLDDVTARAVAWTTGQVLRKTGRSAILVTAQHHLIYDLNPHLWLDVVSMQDAIAVYPDSDEVECSLHHELEYDLGTPKDWLRLKPFHYAAGNPATVHSYHVLRHRESKAPWAVIALSYPDLHSAARNLALGDHFKNTRNPAIIQELNRSMLRLSRIVVAPEVRQIGLAKRLISEIANRVDCRYLECTTSMARYSPFLAASGFSEVPQALSPFESAWMDFATQVNLDPRSALDPEELRRSCQALTVRQARQAHRHVWQLYHHLVLHRRTRGKPRLRVPNYSDQRWTDAFDLAARRLNDRPAYWIRDLQPHGEPQCRKNPNQPDVHVNGKPPANQPTTLKFPSPPITAPPPAKTGTGATPDGPSAETATLDTDECWEVLCSICGLDIHFTHEGRPAEPTSEDPEGFLCHARCSAPEPDGNKV